MISRSKKVLLGRRTFAVPTHQCIMTDKDRAEPRPRRPSEFPVDVAETSTTKRMAPAYTNGCHVQLARSRRGNVRICGILLSKLPTFLPRARPPSRLYAFVTSEGFVARQREKVSFERVIRRKKGAIGTMSIQWEQWFSQALPYTEYLDTYGTDAQRERWQGVSSRVNLTPAQTELLGGFTRQMNVLVVSGTWCGDCAHQGPILQKFAETTPRIDLRFLERDEVPQLRDQIKINGGTRVPVVIFLSEDFYECARYGERVLAFYRQVAQDQLGPACPVGIVPPGEQIMAAATAEWLNEFERVQLMLRLSPRLRERHGD